MIIQVTIFDKNKVYKPLSTTIDFDKVKTAEDLKTYQKEIINKGYQKIACKKYLTSSELFSQGYTIAKVREYDKEKIDKANLMKYAYKNWLKKKESAK